MRLDKKVIHILVMMLIIVNILEGDTVVASRYDSNWHDDAIINAESVDKTANEICLPLIVIENEEDTSKEVEIATVVPIATILPEIYTSNVRIGKVAAAEVGNVGGEKFWSWYGFTSYNAWCCCFVSWCADQCGFIDSGIFPKFSSVSQGYQIFRSNNQWLSGNQTPEPGMVIFFNYYSSGPNHVGLVTGVEDGYVYCVEGNYNDMVAQTKYQIGDSLIYGYGVPVYN